MSSFNAVRALVLTLILSSPLISSSFAEAGKPGSGNPPNTIICQYDTVRLYGNGVVYPGFAMGNDSLGTYVNGSQNVLVHVQDAANIVPNSTSTRKPVRFLTFDLTRPAEAGVPALGNIKDFYGNFHAFYYREGDAVISVKQIPIGATVYSDRIELGVKIGGRQHVMQFGPYAKGSCHSWGTTISGDGTSRGTITRLDEKNYEINLPEGSVGRLFDNQDGDHLAVNKGLYYFSLRALVTVN